MMWYNMCLYPILSNWGIIYEWIYLSIPKAYFPLKRCLKRAISSWEGKICAITGASEGLGAVIALHLAQVGVTCHETTCLGTQKMGSVPGNLGKIVAQNPAVDHHLSPFSWPFFWVYSNPIRNLGKWRMFEISRRGSTSHVFCDLVNLYCRPLTSSLKAKDGNAQ